MYIIRRYVNRFAFKTSGCFFLTEVAASHPSSPATGSHILPQPSASASSLYRPNPSEFYARLGRSGILQPDSRATPMSFNRALDAMKRTTAEASSTNPPGPTQPPGGQGQGGGQGQTGRQQSVYETNYEISV